MSTALISNTHQQQLLDALSGPGWCVIPDFYTSDLYLALHQEVLLRAEQQQLQAAKIGKGTQQQIRSDIRGDATLWLDGSSQAQQQFLAIQEELRLLLNQNLFLGLHELEAHFALYPPGSGYGKHLDSFQNNNLRRITTVNYLNPDWQASDGGELLLFDLQDQIIERVLPLGGTLVCFISELMPHQVAITHKQRASIAGWFRIREI